MSQAEHVRGNDHVPSWGRELQNHLDAQLREVHEDLRGKIEDKIRDGCDHLEQHMSQCVSTSNHVVLEVLNEFKAQRLMEIRRKPAVTPIASIAKPALKREEAREVGKSVHIDDTPVMSPAVSICHPASPSGSIHRGLGELGLVSQPGADSSDGVDIGAGRNEPNDIRDISKSEASEPTESLDLVASMRKRIRFGSHDHRQSTRDSKGSSPPATTSTRKPSIVTTMQEKRKKKMSYQEQEKARKEKAASQSQNKLRNSMSGVTSLDEFLQRDDSGDGLTPIFFGERISGARERIFKFVQSQTFDYIFAMLIVLNALYIGLQVELKSIDAEAKRSGGQPVTPETVNSIMAFAQYIFSISFLVELLFRLWASGCKFFYDREDAVWNILDLTIVTLSCIEMAMETLAMASNTYGERMENVSIVRLIRFIRIIRIVRIIRIMRFFRSLRILITSIFCTLKSLIWAMVLLVIIMYLFAIIFTQAVVQYLETVDSDDAESLIMNHYYGHVARSVGTLFMSITNGISWERVYRPLSSISSVYVSLFIFYIIFSSFAVLNVVTGVFCQGAIESAERDEDEVIASQLTSIEKYTEQLQKLFADIDSSESGTITLETFERYMQEDRVKAYFQALDLHIHEAWTLFKLIDSEETNELDITDFIEGCLRMRGSAKSLEVNEMMYQNRWMMDRITDFMEEFDEVMELLFQKMLGPGSPGTGNLWPSSVTNRTKASIDKAFSRQTTPEQCAEFQLQPVPSQRMPRNRHKARKKTTLTAARAALAATRMVGVDFAANTSAHSGARTRSATDTMGVAFSGTSVRPRSRSATEELSEVDVLPLRRSRLRQVRYTESIDDGDDDQRERGTYDNAVSPKSSGKIVVGFVDTIGDADATDSDNPVAFSDDLDFALSI